MVLALALAGCGAIGTPVVVEEATAVGDVKIVPITAQSVNGANASTYEPRTLPAIFTQTAGTHGSVANLGSLPSPAFDQQARPGNPAMILPPQKKVGPYRIGVGDVVVLSTPQSGSTVSELSGLLAAQNRRSGYTVQDDGSISIPDVGRVEIAGRTLQEAEAVLFQTLVDAQIEPSFSLEVTEFNSKRISLGGAVKSPKTIPITLSPLVLSDAVAAAGGVTVQSADYASIRIYRDGSLYQIPLRAYLSRAELQRTPLSDGDNIFVDTDYDLESAQGYFSQQIALQNLRSTARTNALNQLSTEIGIRQGELAEARTNYGTLVNLDAVERDYVYVAGEVGQQSRFTLPFERKASLADALFSEGEGVPNASGNIGEVYVLRGTGDGLGIRAWHLDAYNAANLVLATRFELRPNDVVFVSEKPLVATGRVMAQLATTLAVLLP
ncbi:polysaccharide biosynthesis/export family protein [Maritimibacter sp. DP4N28-5]|uniref:Polysaccharide biosynthesis/export family protein n=2 Tax=Maritimibacter dapengensis TaxID=2836868 RepID=A0ABS6T7Z5_9RHOB|nr:polysaccharide biosynthesis/export family protein [Maritimibacter dapengensis]